MWIDDQRVEKLLERPHSVGQNRANSQERPALLLPRNTAATYRLTQVYAFQLCVLGCSVVSVISWTVACQTPLSMGFSSKNTEVGYHFLLSFPIFHGIFLTQGSSRHFLRLRHWQADSLHLRQRGRKPGEHAS